VIGRRRDGSRFPAEIGVAEATLGPSSLYAVVVRDRSEASWAEAEQALVRHAAELERSNAELREFAYVASHDLQAPLRTVGSYAQLVAERYRGRLDARADRWLGYVVSGVERMQHLIADLLALAQVRTAEGTAAPTDTAEVVTRTWERLRAGHTGSDAQLMVGALPTVVANAAQLEQLFQNLLGNALKYRRPAVPARIHVSAERRLRGDAAEWEFTVADNGIGLEMVHAVRIFQIFQRLHRDDDHEGTGIGLAICKRIVERHGGRIWVESTPGEGARFRFTIPERER
jgi:light-regulated signal transduction histidine kinase (bacteriophytochrome)